VFRNVGIKIQTPGNCAEESIKHSEQGESVKSRIFLTFVEYLQYPKFDRRFRFLDLFHASTAIVVE